MSGLKNSWEISLEKSNKMNPELKSQKKLTSKQKKEIAEIRKEYEARIDRDGIAPPSFYYPKANIGVQFWVNQLLIQLKKKTKFK